MANLRPVARDAPTVGAPPSGRPTPRPVSSAPRPTPPLLQRRPAERRPDTTVTGAIGANLDVRV